MDMTLINQDICLFNEKFPATFDFNKINWTTFQECSPGFLESNNKKASERPIFYSVNTNTIILDGEYLEIDWLRLHELGHAIHHIMFDFKRFNFSKEYEVTIPLYWGIPNYKRNHYEIFADVFADTMLRFRKPECAMFDYNHKIIKIIKRGDN